MDDTATKSYLQYFYIKGQPGLWEVVTANKDMLIFRDIKTEATRSFKRLKFEYALLEEVTFDTVLGRIPLSTVMNEIHNYITLNPDFDFLIFESLGKPLRNTFIETIVPGLQSGHNDFKKVISWYKLLSELKLFKVL